LLSHNAFFFFFFFGGGDGENLGPHSFFFFFFGGTGVSIHFILDKQTL
jgi:hypothetical protein